MHFLNLREDSHAQWEIQVFANAVHELIEPVVPVALEAFKDYWQEAETFSRMEMELIRENFSNTYLDDEYLESHGLSKREIADFRNKTGVRRITN